VILAAAFCPHPPVLVPEVAGAAAPELDDLRAACDAVIDELAASGATRMIVLGAGPAGAVFSAGAPGSLTGFGVPLHVMLGAAGWTPAGAPPMPLSLTIGAWFLSRTTGLPLDVHAVAVSYGPTATSSAMELEALLADDVDCALLVMGDGSARRSTSAPGYLDDRAESFDADVAKALATGDADALAAIDLSLGSDLLAAGSPAWQLAGTALADPQSWNAVLHYDQAPYGVGYFVASWRRA
jgi:hypothetical protein